MKIRTLPLLITLVLAATAHADGLAVPVNPLAFPLGFSADVTKRLSDRFSLCAGAGLLTSDTTEDFEFGGMDYDFTVKLGGANAFLAWHPFTGRFHVSGGLTSVRGPWSLKGASVSSYTINGTRYPAREVGALSGEIRFGNAVAPAILLGWGNPVRPGKRLGFVFDLGLAYVGKQDFVLRASGPLASDPSFQADLAAEERGQSGDHSFWPVAKIGVSYQF